VPTRSLATVPRSILRSPLPWAGLGLCLVCCHGDRDELPPLPPRVSAEPPPAGPARPAERLVLAWVGEVRGELDVCGCPTQPLGGFERRAGLLTDLRAEGPPVFHLDAGNLLVEGFATGGRGDAAERARWMLDLSADVGLDAFCPAPGDLRAMGPDLLAEALSARGIAAVSATWLGPDGQPLFAPAVVLERGGVRLGVVGLSAAPRGASPAVPGATRDPVDAARDALATMPADLDLVVALSNLEDDDALRVGREVDGIAALLSVTNGAYGDPQEVGGTALAKAPSRGRYVGVLRVRVASEAGRTLDLSTASALRLPTFDKLSARAHVLELQGDQLPEPDRRSLAQITAGLAETGAGRNLGWYSAVPLGDRYVGDPRTHARVLGYKQEVLREADARLAEADERADAPRHFLSSARCVGCHTEQTARWALTRHTQAWEVLIARGADQDPECVTCHATGFGLAGGWARIGPETVTKFKAVQCEACHGALEGHPQDPTVRPVRPDRGTCLTCHDPANSPDFDYATYLPRATCSVKASERAPVSEGRSADAPPSGR